MSATDIAKQELDASGAYKRAVSGFRHFISRETGARFPPEKGRYHLYVSLACPWATRTVIVRKLKGLEDVEGITVVAPTKNWPMGDVVPFPGATADPHNGARDITDIYRLTDANYSGRYSVPVLWDTKERTIVNNESSEIIRMLNSEFADFLAPDSELAGNAPDLYPAHLRAEIDALSAWVYADVNNGVYKCMFAASQEAYDAAVHALFAALDRLEAHLPGKDFLVGGALTEADVRLYTTIVRFDPVYVSLAKCNVRTIRDGYPEINRWMRRLYWTNRAFRESTDFEHIMKGYWGKILNPSGIVPAGPVPLIQPL